jgi:hypothetical protein
MAIFPFKKEDKEKLPASNSDFLISSEREKKTEAGGQEMISKTISPETEKIKEATEKEGIVKEQPSAVTSAQVQLGGKNIVSSAPSLKSPVLLEVEQILSENLDELYASLTPEQKIIFRQKGEDTASKIDSLMTELKVNVDKILTLVKEWLSLLAQMIPGVNKVFLAKEAKIKTDKILFLKNKEKK